jgi:hypothetical protein
LIEMDSNPVANLLLFLPSPSLLIAILESMFHQLGGGCWGGGAASTLRNTDFCLYNNTIHTPIITFEYPHTPHPHHALLANPDTYEGALTR